MAITDIPLSMSALVKAKGIDVAGSVVAEELSLEVED